MVENAQRTNFQQSSLSRHASLPEHKILMEAPLLQKVSDTARQKQDSKHDTAVKILCKALHCLVTEDIALKMWDSHFQYWDSKISSPASPRTQASEIVK